MPTSTEEPSRADARRNDPRRSLVPVSRERRHAVVIGIALVTALAATLAPVALTGATVVDAVERAIVAGLVTFVAAHGHRWSWFVAGAILAVPARGTSLVLVCVALLVAILFTRSRRRSRPAGAVAVGLMVNAVFWYPDAGLPVGTAHVLALVAFGVLVWSGMGEVGKRHRRVVGAAAAALAVLLVIGAALAGFVGLTSRPDIESGTTAAKAALAAVRQGDSAGAQIRLSEAQLHLRRAHDRLHGPLGAPVGLVPGLAQQVDAVEIAVDQALSVSEAAEELVDTNYDQLRYQGRIDLTTVSALLPQSVRVRDALAVADRRLDAVASRALLPPLRTRVEEFSSQVVSARSDAELAHQLLEVAPGLLGQGGTRRYLIVFMTPAELRGAGGFVGNWVELEAVRGDVNLTRSGRIRELIGARPPGQRTIVGPADYLARYGRFNPADNLQDVTFSPNWPSDASVYSQLYPQSGGRPVDGVIGIDPKGLAGLLELTGPVAVPGLPGAELTAANAVDLLTRDQYLLFAGDTEAREQFLESAIRATFDRLTGASLPAPRRLGEVLGPVARGRHIQLWSPNAPEQRLFERLRADGRVAVPEGQDGLAVVQQNTANNKIDAYLRREVDYEASIDAATATIEATVTIRLHNEVPSLDLGRDVVGNDRGVPEGTNLTSLAVYTPHRVTSATIDDQPAELGAGSELGLRVWETPLLAIPPRGTVTVVLRLQGTLDLSRGYTFRYLPQPLATPEELKARMGVRSGHFTGRGRADRLQFEGPAEQTVELRSGIAR